MRSGLWILVLVSPLVLVRLPVPCTCSLSVSASRSPLLYISLAPLLTRDLFPVPHSVSSQLPHLCSFCLSAIGISSLRPVLNSTLLPVTTDP